MTKLQALDWCLRNGAVIHKPFRDVVVGVWTTNGSVSRCGKTLPESVAIVRAELRRLKRKRKAAGE